MALYIRDDSVDVLASELQRLSNAPTKTEAVRQALSNEINRLRRELPLGEQIRDLQSRFDAIGPSDPAFDAAARKRFRDALWDD